MKICALCQKAAKPDRQLCSDCNQERLSAASVARIMEGTGLTQHNFEQFSEENWIRSLGGPQDDEDDPGADQSDPPEPP